MRILWVVGLMFVMIGCGGGAAGGWDGSNYAKPGSYNIIHTRGAQSGSGKAIITW